LVEVNPRVLSGAPVLRGTRMPVQAIVDNFDYGVSTPKSRNSLKWPKALFGRFWPTRANALRILFDKNVPVGVRGILAAHEVRTVVEMSWPPHRQKHLELLDMIPDEEEPGSVPRGAGVHVPPMPDLEVRRSPGGLPHTRCQFLAGQEISEL
jgi:hypothetical protein